MIHESSEQRLRTIGTIITLVVTTVGVVFGLLTYYTVNELRPLSDRISTVEAVQNHDQETLATKDQVAGISAQLRLIDNEVQVLLAKGIK